MNKQELIEKIENLNKLYGERHYVAIDDVLNLVSQLDEPEKVKIPQFVANWIEQRRKKGEYSLLDAMHLTAQSEEFRKWIMSSKHQNVFARAWLNGYEIEKEHRYTVKIKGLDSDKRVLKKKKGWYFGGYWDSVDDAKIKIHTRKELEDAGFGWVFDCPGIEVEEVQDA